MLPRPAGKRCFVVSSDGTTISRQRNGTMLHRFPSALPHGSRNRDGSGPPSYSILDCIFHEVNLLIMYLLVVRYCIALQVFVEMSRSLMNADGPDLLCD